MSRRLSLAAVDLNDVYTMELVDLHTVSFIYLPAEGRLVCILVRVRVCVQVWWTSTQSLLDVARRLHNECQRANIRHGSLIYINKKRPPSIPDQVATHIKSLHANAGPKIPHAMSIIQLFITMILLKDKCSIIADVNVSKLRKCCNQLYSLFKLA